MSVERIKSEAKLLKKAWPAFVERYGAELPLSGAQELVAQARGFANWQAAVESAKVNTAESRGATAVGRSEAFSLAGLSVVREHRDVIEFTQGGNERPPVEFECLVFRPETRGMLQGVQDELDEYAERNQNHGGDWQSDSAAVGALALARRLVKEQPSFLEGHAWIAGVLVRQGKPQKAIDEVAGVYSAAVALIPPRFKGRILYHDLGNRPFFRLAYNLMLAYYGLNTPEGSKKGSAIAKSMYAWWPNDNMGFRYMQTQAAFDSLGS